MFAFTSGANGSNDYKLISDHKYLHSYWFAITNHKHPRIMKTHKIRNYKIEHELVEQKISRIQNPEETCKQIINVLKETSKIIPTKFRLNSKPWFISGIARMLILRNIFYYKRNIYPGVWESWNSYENYNKFVKKTIIKAKKTFFRKLIKDYLKLFGKL